MLKEMKKVYEKYGYSIMGKIENYESSIFPEMRGEIITELAIVNENNDPVFTMYLGNNWIGLYNPWIENALDCFIWWYKNSMPDPLTTEKEVHNSLCAHNCLFYDRVHRDMKRAAEKEAAEKEAAEKASEWKAIETAAEKAGLLLYMSGEICYVLNFETPEHKESFLNLTETLKERVIELVLDGLMKSVTIVYSFDCTSAMYNGIWYKYGYDFQKVVAFFNAYNKVNTCPCIGCKYFDSCGDSERTTSCVGREPEAK